MENKPNNSKAYSVTALVCGILSIIGSWFGFVSIITLILGIVGIVFGMKGRKTAPAGQTGMATAGFVCAIIGTVFSAIGVICWICICASAGAIDAAANNVLRF